MFGENPLQRRSRCRTIERTFPFNPVNPQRWNRTHTGFLDGSFVQCVICFRITLFTQSKLAWTFTGELNRYFDNLRLIRRSGYLKRLEVIELIHLRHGTQINKVTFIGCTLNGTDAKAQLVFPWRQGLDDVLCFFPACGMFRRQRDKLFLVDW